MQVVYIDTVVIAGMSYKDEATGEIVSGAPTPAHNKPAADAQLQWLEQTLAASTADYLWVSGHYPVYSHCEHGPTLTMIAEVLPLLKK
jgi:tartrate-resistant acid phosphatase type 5